MRGTWRDRVFFGEFYSTYLRHGPVHVAISSGVSLADSSAKSITQKGVECPLETLDSLTGPIRLKLPTAFNREGNKEGRMRARDDGAAGVQRTEKRKKVAK